MLSFAALTPIPKSDYSGKLKLMNCACAEIFPPLYPSYTNGPDFFIVDYNGRRLERTHGR
jgi:hypothetical protein